MPLEQGQTGAGPPRLASLQAHDLQEMRDLTDERPSWRAEAVLITTASAARLGSVDERSTK